MQNLLRKHRILLGWTIVLFIGIPMLFFGVPTFMGGGPQDFVDPDIIEVDGVSVKASEFRANLDAVAQQSAMGGERPTYAELDEQGKVREILDNMVNAALIRREIEQRGFEVDEKFLASQAQKDPIFQNEEGNFDPQLWNDWVESQNRYGQNWNEFYKNYREDLARASYLQLIQKPGGRVLDSELEYQLKDDYTKLKVRYLQVKPPIDESEEKLRAHYQANIEEFRTPASKTATYVVIPLKAEKPAKADELVAQARGGADFSALANEHSEMTTQNGGDLGWRQERETELEHRKPMFALKPGEVSEPIEGPNGYYIYKVEEERYVDGAGNTVAADALAATPDAKREIHARHIFLKAALSDEEKLAKQEEGKKLGERASELGGLEAAAAEMNLQVALAGPFTDESTTVEGIPGADAPEFVRAFRDENISDYNVINAPQGIYVAVLNSKEDGVVPPFEEVREKVLEAYREEAQASDLYKEGVKEYAQKIEEGAKSLEDARSLLPDMTGEIKELDFFNRKEMLWQQQFYVMPSQIYEEIGREPIGSMSGPLEDFRGDTYFVELVDRTEPTEEDKAKWPEEKKQLRDQMAARNGGEILEDYALFLRQEQLPELSVSFNNDLIEEIIGRNVTPVGEGEAEGVADVPAEAPLATATDGVTVTPAEAPAATEAPVVVEEAPVAETPAEEGLAPVEAPPAEVVVEEVAVEEVVEEAPAETPAAQ